jgi:hypothetical protein
MNPGPFRWFWAARVTKPCPDCGHKTSVGFDRNDPGAQDREPSRCAHCTSAAIDNAAQFARGEIGYPLTEQGPCVSCHAPARRYGPQARPACAACAGPAPAIPEPGTAVAADLPERTPESRHAELFAEAS